MGGDYGTVREDISMENLREFFQQGKLPWPYTGYKC